MRTNLYVFTLMLGVLSFSANASQQALADACTPVDASYLDYTNTDLGAMTSHPASVWNWDNYHYAKARVQGGGVGYLCTPALNLSGAESVTIAFTHAHNYAENPSSDYTLWVTDNWQGSVDASSWQQLIIDPYGTNKDWNWVNVSLEVPVMFVGANTVFAFKYTSTATKNGTWEIKNLTVTSTCPSGSGGDDLTPPVAIPDLGDGRLKVCGQNLRNYYYNYQTNDRPDYNTPEGFAEKTRKIISAMRMLDADIYAFCELEAQDIILRQFVDSINAHIGDTVYAYVVDDIDVPNETRTNNIKSGFFYRVATVRPVGPNSPVYSVMYYGETMRVQAFEEISTGARFTLSMNHFKAKDGTEDNGNTMRINNATRLVQNLPSLALDPDILILGDLNCQVGEAPLTIIQNAGYEEQLLRFDSAAYSHCWDWSGELIDHAYANASMAAQITGAGVFHITTGCEDDADANYNYRYSDHDPYIVALDLVASAPVTECEESQHSYLPTGADGLGEMSANSLSGQWNWRYQASYGATCQDKGGEDWLITPSYDLSMAQAVTVSFDHAINYGNVANLQQEQSMWVTPDYTGITTSEWTQVTIPNYPAGTSWTFVPASVNVPQSLFGPNTAIAFKYAVPADAINSPTWEVKNLQVNISCDEVPQGLDNISDRISSEPTKFFENGVLLIRHDGKTYNVLGIQTRQ